MSFEVFLLVAAVLLALGALPVIYRMIVGPTILDRAVSLDVLMVLVVMALGLHMAHTGDSYAIVPALALTATGFIGTLALARFVARDDAAVLHHDDEAIKANMRREDSAVDEARAKDAERLMRQAEEHAAAQLKQRQARAKRRKARKRKRKGGH